MCTKIEDSYVEGYFCFIICGGDLDPDEIMKNIKLKPSEVKRKGELITKDIKMKDSYWTYLGLTPAAAFSGCCFFIC